MRQEALAQQLGTSRIPVREALQELESEGLVTLVRHSGARVARFDLDECIELFRIREAVEPMAIAESLTRMTAPTLEELHHLAQQIESSRHDLEAWIKHDRDFHLLTYSAAPFSRLLNMIAGFWNTTQVYRRIYVSIFTEHDYDISHMEHRMILDALDRHDPVDAAERERSHIRRTRLALTERAPELLDQRSGSSSKRSGHRD